MTREELRGLVVGDRVRLDQPGGSVVGTVTQKARGAVWVFWGEGGGHWVLNHRSRFDRERAKNLTKLPPEGRPLIEVLTEDDQKP